MKESRVGFKSAPCQLASFLGGLCESKRRAREGEDQSGVYGKKAQGGDGSSSEIFHGKKIKALTPETQKIVTVEDAMG